MNNAAGLGLTLLTSLMLSVSCTNPGESAKLPQNYETRILQVDDTLLQGIRNLALARGSPSSEKEMLEWQLEDARKAQALSRRALREARGVTPPTRYQIGHELLIRLYSDSQAFFSLEAERITHEIDGNPTSVLEKQLAEAAATLLQLRTQVMEALPFLREESLPTMLTGPVP